MRSLFIVVGEYAAIICGLSHATLFLKQILYNIKCMSFLYRLVPETYLFLVIQGDKNLHRYSCQALVILEKNPNTHFMINFFDKCAVHEIRVMWKNTERPDRPQIILWCKRIACWITQATSTHSECVTIMAFLLQQW